MQPAQTPGNLGWYGLGFPVLGGWEVSLAPPSENERAEVEYWGDRIFFGVQPRHVPCSSVLILVLVKSG